MRPSGCLFVLLTVLWLAAPAHAWVAEDCVQGRDPDLQISACTAMIQSGQLAPANLAVAFNNRGLAYSNLGQFRQAIEDLDRALRLNPTLAVAYNNRGLTYNRLGQPRRAIVDLDRAIDLDPSFASSHYNRGISYGQLGHFQKAIEEFNEALRLGASDADLYIERGVAYLNLEEPRQAIKDFDRAIRLDPEIAGAYFGRGEANSFLGEYRQAIEDFERALQIDPSYDLAKHGLAVALREMDRRQRSGDQSRPRASTGGPYDATDRDTIIAAQKMLAQLGLYKDAIDGIAGPNTRRAVREFQEAWGYPPTGEVDKRLLGQLDVATKAEAAVAEKQATEDNAAEEDERLEPAPDQAAELEVTSAGSGFFVTEDGWILTNRHVVEDCAEVDVVVDGNRISTTRKVVSLASDLALVKAGYAPLSVARFRAGKGIRPGETVVAIGFPLLGLLSPEINVTTGNVSALAGIRGDATKLQHTAPIQPGNSGGPLLDDSGNVVGVVVAKANALEFAKVTGDIPENIGFAIKASLARDFLDAEGIDYATAPSDVRQDIAELVVQARPHVALVLCMR